MIKKESHVADIAFHISLAAITYPNLPWIFTFFEQAGYIALLACSACDSFPCRSIRIETRQFFSSNKRLTIYQFFSLSFYILLSLQVTVAHY